MTFPFYHKIDSVIEIQQDISNENQTHFATLHYKNFQMKEESKTFYKEAINRAIDFIEQNLNQPIYLEDIANKAHLS